MQGSMWQVSYLKNQKNEDNCYQGGTNFQPQNIRKIKLGFKRVLSDFSDHPDIKTQTGKTVGRHQNCAEKGKNSKKSRTQLARNHQGQEEKKERIGRSSSKNINGAFYHYWGGRMLGDFSGKLD